MLRKRYNNLIRDFTQKLHYFQSYLTSSYQNNYTTSLSQNYDLHSIKIDNGQNDYTEQNNYTEQNTQEDDNQSI